MRQLTGRIKYFLIFVPTTVLLYKFKILKKIRGTCIARVKIQFTEGIYSELFNLTFFAIYFRWLDFPSSVTIC